MSATIEDLGDELRVRRPDGISDEQWARIREALVEQGWEPVLATACPDWCTDHRDLSDEQARVHEHRSRALTGAAVGRVDGPDLEPDDSVKVWASQYVWEQGPEPAGVVVELPAGEQETITLEPAWARDLAGSLLEAAHLLDGQGRTNSAPGYDT
jgi:hypothetical protein